MANFIEDGVVLNEAVLAIHNRWTATKDSKSKITRALLKDMRDGRRIGESLGKFSPTMEAMAIDAGEGSGDAAEGFRMALKLTTTTGRIKSTIIGELFYPAFLLTILVFFLLALKSRVMPVFEEILPRDNWPGITSALSVVADNVTIILFFFFTSVAAIMFSYRMTKARWVGSARDSVDSYISPWKMNRKISGAVILTCFAALSRMGVPFETIITRLLSSSSPWEKYHLTKMMNKMRRGQAPADALSCDLFSDQVNWEISIYGKLSSFSKALESISNRVIEDVISGISTLMTIIRSLIMISVAGMAVWVYASFFAITMAAKSAGA